MKTVAVGKSRRIVGLGKKETWIRAQITQEFETEPTMEDIQELLSDVEVILEMEEKDERTYWRTENQPRQ